MLPQSTEQLDNLTIKHSYLSFVPAGLVADAWRRTIAVTVALTLGTTVQFRILTSKGVYIWQNNMVLGVMTKKVPRKNEKEVGYFIFTGVTE